MISILHKLKKLRGRNLDELRVRGAQAAHAFAERRGWSEQARVPSDAAMLRLIDAAQPGGGIVTADSLLAHFHARPSKFFAGFDDKEGTTAELRGRFGGETQKAVVERAERIIAGRFDLLGLRDLNFGDPIDWHLEPVSGKRTPRAHWSRIAYLDAGVAGDKKITWELNRQQYFMTLGRAYWHTNDERYARTFAAHLDAWMDANPPKLGINWASSLEVAFRAMSWAWAFHFFKDSPHLTPPLFLRALKFLYLHARHLETYLSTYFSPNTHLTGEALGLLYVGTILPELRAAARWRALGSGVMLAELERHVRPDGVYFEQSSYYHRYTADFYTHLYLLARRHNESDQSVIEKKLSALLDHLMFITRPDGTTPLFGDDDGGRLVQLDERAANDFRATLANGAALFRRADYKYVAGAEATEELLWLCGVAELKIFDQLDSHPPARGSQAFADGGYYVMRDGWTERANYLLIDCGPHGQANCGHAHADALSFELAARGRTLLVDPGTYTYTASSELRDSFRGAAAHNVLLIDGEPSSVPGAAFTWRHVAQSAPRQWISRERFDYFEGAHDGYGRLNSPATHARSILFLKNDYWVMRDTIETTGAHTYETRFHLIPETHLVIEATENFYAVRERGDAAAPALQIFSPAIDGAWQSETGWMSDCYGRRREAPICARSIRATGPQNFVTFLIPHAAPQLMDETRVLELDAQGGRAFSLQMRGDVNDVLLITGGQLVEAGRITTDCAWAWLRFRRGEELPEELILIGGRQLLLDDREIIRAATPLGYLAARRAGNKWLVETDADVSFSMIAPDASRPDIALSSR